MTSFLLKYGSCFQVGKFLSFDRDQICIKNKGPAASSYEFVCNRKSTKTQSVELTNSQNFYSACK